MKNKHLDFPNLPYLLDDSTGLKITEFVAICNYLSAKTGLAGNSIEEKAIIDQLISVGQEIRKCASW